MVNKGFTLTLISGQNWSWWDTGRRTKWKQNPGLGRFWPQQIDVTPSVSFNLMAKPNYFFAVDHFCYKSQIGNFKDFPTSSWRLRFSFRIRGDLWFTALSPAYSIDKPERSWYCTYTKYRNVKTSIQLHYVSSGPKHRAVFTTLRLNSM